MNVGGRGGELLARLSRDHAEIACDPRLSEAGREFLGAVTIRLAQWAGRRVGAGSCASSTTARLFDRPRPTGAQRRAAAGVRGQAPEVGGEQVRRAYLCCLQAPVWSARWPW